MPGSGMAGMKESEGLVARRIAEFQIFLHFGSGSWMSLKLCSFGKVVLGLYSNPVCEGTKQILRNLVS